MTSHSDFSYNKPITLPLIQWKTIQTKCTTLTNDITLWLLLQQANYLPFHPARDKLNLSGPVFLTSAVGTLARPSITRSLSSLAERSPNLRC
ncbi:hypothetical protein RRG08_001608 [Elysia crispata]|uniref:Uncharacterized protein n=1 Tax=Elysia crispata TaxID=231223 RepID=A0AAE1AKB5_9GAST|nr:hypothetical protein RRG08_001608 [Elysia crispata]